MTYSQTQRDFEGVSSDHRIVSVKIRQSLRRNKTQTSIASYDLSSLVNCDISNQFTVSVRNKFDRLQETSERHTPNDEYERFLTTHIETASKCVPSKGRLKCRVPWKSMAVREKRDNVQKTSILNKRNRTNANAQKPKKALTVLAYTKKNN